MLRRGFLKLLGAAIAVPWIGWPARRVARWSKWNLWIGGDDGQFYNPDCWSHRQVPTNGASIAVNDGYVMLPEDVSFDDIVLYGSGSVMVQARLGNTSTKPLAVGSLIVAESFTGTIGKQGETL